MANNKKRRPDTRSQDTTKTFASGRNSSSRRNNRTSSKTREDKKVSATPGFAFQRWDNAFPWYNANPELLAAACRVPFANRPGMFVDGGSMLLDSADSDTTVRLTQAVPGFMRIQYAYGVGFSDSVEAAASRCAQQMFKNIRERFSGTLEADAPDLMMYAIAIEQVHAYIAWLKRLYRSINAYSPDNHMLPEQLIRAQIANAGIGLNAQRIYLLARDKVRLYGYINTLVNMINKFELPMDMPLYERHRWMNEFVYSDINSVRGQMYVFCPTGFFQVNDESATGTSLTWKPFTVDSIDWDDPVSYFFNYGMELISAIVESEDAYTINGYIARAYEGVPTYRSIIIAQEEIVSPVYSEEVLSQIHNLTVITEFGQSDITQNPGDRNTIYYKPTGLSLAGLDGVLLDLEGDSPDGEAVTIATRLSAGARENPTTHEFELVCGTEVVTDICITIPEFFLPGQSAFTWNWAHVGDLIFMYNRANPNLSWRNTVEYAKFISYLSSWRKAPRCVARAWDIDDPAATGSAWLVGELDNIGFMSTQDLATLHRVCLYSEFNAFPR